MRTPELVEIALRVLSVIERTNNDFVPTRLFLYEYPKMRKGSCLSVCHRMARAGILETKLGAAGGYRQARKTNLLELYGVLTPSELIKEESCSRKIRTLQQKVWRLMKHISICPLNK